jgi:hypothetical protein
MAGPGLQTGFTGQPLKPALLFVCHGIAFSALRRWRPGAHGRRSGRLGLHLVFGFPLSRSAWDGANTFPQHPSEAVGEGELVSLELAPGDGEGDFGGHEENSKKGGRH